MQRFRITRPIAVSVSVAIALAFGSGLVALSAYADDSADSERLVRIEAMYGEFRSNFSGIGEISADTLMAWVDAGNIVIVDVRRPAEREVSRIPGSVTREELDTLLASDAKAGTNAAADPDSDPDSTLVPGAEGAPDRRIVAYCTIGYRSGMFTRSLKEKGVEAYNLEGGILAWVHHEGPIEDAQAPTRQVHVYGEQWSLLPEAYEPTW